MKRLVLSALLGVFAMSSVMGDPGEYMKVAPQLVIDGSNRCYQIKKGYSRRDKTEWENFCGEFDNFFYQQGYEYTIYVKKYDPQADTIYVIKALARDNSEEYMKQLERRKRRQERLKNEGK